jgi:hypothetical protein
VIVTLSPSTSHLYGSGVGDRDDEGAQTEPGGESKQSAEEAIGTCDDERMPASGSAIAVSDGIGDGFASPLTAPSGRHGVPRARAP